MDLNNIKEMRKFNKQLATAKQKEEQKDTNSNANDSSSNLQEPRRKKQEINQIQETKKSKANNQPNLDISSVRNKQYYTPPKEPIKKNKTKPSPTDKLEHMFSDIDNTRSQSIKKPIKKNLTPKDKLDYMLEDVNGDKLSKTTLAKAAAGNPIAIAKVADQMRKKKKKKKKKNRTALIVSLIFLTIPTYILITTIPTFLIMTAIDKSSNSLLDVNDILARKYAQKYLDEDALRKIPQKFKSDKDTDPDLDKMEDTPKSDLYTIPSTSKIPYFSQHDPRWKDLEYCPGETYSLSACAPTTLAMILTHIGYTELDSDGDGITLPTDTGSYSLSKGYATTLGTLPGLFLDLKGVNVDYYTPSNIDKVKEILAKGEPIAYSVNGSITFASSHLLVATGYKDGMFTVNDPNSVKLTEQTFTEAEFMSGAYYFVHIYK